MGFSYSQNRPDWMINFTQSISTMRISFHILWKRRWSNRSTASIPQSVGLRCAVFAPCHLCMFISITFTIFQLCISFCHLVRNLSVSRLLLPKPGPACPSHYLCCHGGSQEWHQIRGTLDPSRCCCSPLTRMISFLTWVLMCVPRSIVAVP